MARSWHKRSTTPSKSGSGPMAAVARYPRFAFLATSAHRHDRASTDSRRARSSALVEGAVTRSSPSNKAALFRSGRRVPQRLRSPTAMTCHRHLYRTPPPRKGDMTLRPRRLGQHCSGLLSGFSAGRLRLPWTGVGPILDPEPMLPLHVAVQPVVHRHADHPFARHDRWRVQREA